MACYHPQITIKDLSKWETAKDGHKYHPSTVVGEGFIFESENLKKIMSGYYSKTETKCRKCMGCRLDYAKEWANRGYLHSLMYEGNYFVTLTYDEDHINIPEYIEDREGFTYTNDGTWNGNLVPKELQQFFKNLRQIQKRKTGKDGISYMACGEYGSKGARPHYHAIIFGLDLPPDDFFEPRIINKEVYYRSKTIERAWTKGISNICPSNWNTIGYVARYITKKINGEGSEKLYAANGKIKEFMRVSLKPAIGKPYYDRYKDEIYKNDRILIHNKKGSFYTQPPEYFDELLKKDNPKLYEEIKYNRAKKAEMQNRLKDQTTSLSRREQRHLEERTLNPKVQSLKRSMEQGSQ